MANQSSLLKPFTLLEKLLMLCKSPPLVIYVAFKLLFSSLPFHPLHALHWRQRLIQFALLGARRFYSFRETYRVLSRDSTAKIIQSHCKANSLELRTTTVPTPKTSTVPPATLHSIQLVGVDEPSDITVFYIHGGGYLYPMSAKFHIPLARHIAQHCKAARIVYLEYSLTPQCKYPGQLVQITAAFQYLMHSGLSPSNIVLAGDSAGGHLITSLLAHLTTPAPSVPPLDFGGEQIRAVILISPWVNMAGEDSESHENEIYDYITCRIVRTLTHFFSPDPHHCWAAPLHAADATALWSRAFSLEDPKKSHVGRLLITAGELEILRDSCQEFADKFLQATNVGFSANCLEAEERIKASRFVFALGSKEVHVQSGLDLAVGHNSGTTTAAMAVFLESLASRVS